MGEAMTKQDAQQLIAWLNRIADYVPPIHMREATNFMALKVLAAVASGEVAVDVAPVKLSEGRKE